MAFLKENVPPKLNLSYNHSKHFACKDKNIILNFIYHSKKLGYCKQNAVALFAYSMQ